MRIYLSYPMTNAIPADVDLRRQVRYELGQMKDIQVYDPEVCEPAGMSMTEIQEWDFERMEECDALLVIWSSSAASSGGVLEEIGWARRIFNIPACIYQPNTHYRISPWTAASVFQNVRSDLKDAVRLLRALAEDFPAEKVVV